MPGVLYVVATPIGNLGDITRRAVDTLRACHRIAAEDTRHTRALLAHLDLTGHHLEALHAYSAPRDVARLVDCVLAGEDIAVVTDAGTPSVSDPGGEIVRLAIEAGIRVVPVPGASAVLAALVGSGLSADGRFRFLGFLPREGAARRDAILTVCATPETVVLFEAPGRTASTLQELAEATPTRAGCVARELTKVHEELTRGTLAELARDPREWRGEVVVVLGPYDPGSRSEVTDDALDARIDEALEAGDHARSIADRLAALSGRPRREVYARVLQRRRRG